MILCIETGTDVCSVGLAEDGQLTALRESDGRDHARNVAVYVDEMLRERNLLDGLEGVIIQEMVKGSREMVCGVATDPQYGHMMMFGLGGVFIEVMKDVTFRMAPLTDIDAHEMIRGVKAYKLLEGARGTTPAQLDQLENVLLRLSQLVTDVPEIEELDINPLIISEKNGEGIAVDGRIKLKA